MARRWLSWLLAGMGLFVLGAGAKAEGWTPETFSFASQEEAAAFLSTPDGYTKALTPLDLSVRLKTDRDVSADEYLRFAAAAARNWSPEQTAALRLDIAKLAETLNALHIPAPQRIQLIRTSGEEEGHAAYTRGTAIMLPEAFSKHEQGEQYWYLAHETFHVISRFNPALREQLYAAFGFVKVEPFTLPPQIAAQVITNPDALANDHFTRVTVDDEDVCGAPVLMFAVDRYEPAQGGDFFNSAKNRFVVSRHIAQRKGGAPEDLRAVPANQVGGLRYRIGENTGYTIHPEEIVAENFALLVTGLKKPATPEVIERMRAVFAGTARPATPPACP